MVVPKAAIYQTQTFYAKGKMKDVKQLVANLRGESLSSGKTETWNGKMLKIPPVSPSILDCSIIRVEYSLMVSTIMRRLDHFHIIFQCISRYCRFGNTSLATSSTLPWPYHHHHIITCFKCRSVVEVIFPTKSISLLVKHLADSAHIAKTRPWIAPVVISTCS